MVDVKHYFRKDEDLPQMTLETWLDLLVRREKTFQGFASLEVKQGILTPKISFSLARGQDILRLMLFRVLEECAESALSDDPIHFKEEAVDATNYMLSALMLDEELFPPEKIAPRLMNICRLVDDNYWGICASRQMDYATLGRLVIKLCGELPDTFRNRAWMENTQHTYFEGVEEVFLSLDLVMVNLLRSFDNWKEFVNYYLAKDDVLQFRLSSQY